MGHLSRSSGRDGLLMEPSDLQRAAFPAWGPHQGPSPFPTPGLLSPNTSPPSSSSPAPGTPGSSLKKAQRSWEGQPHHSQHFLCWAPAQLPSFLLQDPRVQEKEVPPPLSAGLWQPSRPSSPLTWGPREVLEEPSGRTEGPGLAEGLAQVTKNPQARPVGVHAAKWGALGGGRDDSGLPKE